MNSSFIKSNMLLNILVIVIIFSFSLSAQEQEKPSVELHGALRFNYRLQTWNKLQKKRGGDIGYDMFSVNPKASYKGLTLQVEYRFYSQESGGGLLRQGDITYTFENKDKFVIGLTKVPFGIEPYNSHNYYLSMGYYMGLEDDYDVGFKYVHIGKEWEYQFAFFKNSEDFFLDQQSPRRYSYDVIGENKETNQLNAKVVYKADIAENFNNRIGVSLMYGGLHHLPTNKYGSHNAWAVHYEATAGEFNAKAQVTSFAKNPKGADKGFVELGAYNGKFNLADKGQLYTIGASYNIPLKSKVFDNIKVYNDYSYFDKTKKEYEDSFSNSFGLMIHAGNIYTYAEFIASKNQSSYNEEPSSSFAEGNDKVQTLFNINIGYYF